MVFSFQSWLSTRLSRRLLLLTTAAATAGLVHRQQAKSATSSTSASPPSASTDSVAPHDHDAVHHHDDHPDDLLALADNQVRIVVQGDYRYVYANGVPNHATGEFPNSGNPNTIAEQTYTFRMPAYPQVAETATAFTLGKFGVAINGVPFDPGAAEFWNRDFNSGWQYEALSGRINLGMDQNHAHVQPNGAYHYHGAPTGLIQALGNGERMLLLGYAGDGFPIYGAYGYADAMDSSSTIRQMQSSYRLKSGVRPSGPGGTYDGTFVQDYEYVANSGDLDDCNGRFGVTPEYPEGIYHYYITETFPFISRKFRGTPDPSFVPPGGQNGRPPLPPDGAGQGQPGRPPGRPPNGSLPRRN